MQKFEQIQLSRSEIIINNFLGGIAWGLGSVLGATVLVSLIGWLVVRSQYFPLIQNVIQLFQK